MKTRTEQGEQSRETLRKMLVLLGVDARVHVGETDESAKGIVLEVDTADAGKIIGRGGEKIAAFELLLNRMLRSGGEPFPMVRIVVEGYRRHNDGGSPRQKRGRSVDEERFTALAMDAAKEVKKWGLTKQLGPFTARERRVIHLALRDDPDVESASGPEESDGRKKVIIRLRDKVETEDEAGSAE